MWTCTVSGREGTAYEGGRFKLRLQFPRDYPFSPPSVLFDTYIYHPGFLVTKQSTIPQPAWPVKFQRDCWSPRSTVQDVLLELQDAISTPEKFVNDVGITQELHKEPSEFHRKAAACTVEFARETP